MLEQLKSIETVKAVREHLDELTFQDIFYSWGAHQKRLYGLCNKLLKFHIKVHKLPPESLDRLPIMVRSDDAEV